MRRKYWSCTKLADKIRGIKKPASATSLGWDIFESECKSFNSIRYWIAEELLDNIQNIIYYPSDKFYSMISYLDNRFIIKTHQLTSHKDDIKPGSWCDLDYRISSCLFNELVDFVEIEKAWMQVNHFNDDNKYPKPTTFEKYFTKWRNPQAGVDYLMWETTLVYETKDSNHGKKTPQAEHAEKILEVYHWFKNIYKNYPDISEITGWSDYCSCKRLKNGLLNFEESTIEEREKSKKIRDEMEKIENERLNDETRMLNTIINIRKSLWT